MVKKESQEQTRSSIQTSGHGNLSRPTSGQIGQRGRTPPRPGLLLLAAVKKHPVIAVLVFILSVLAVLTLFPSEEKKVRKQFHLLAEWVSKEPGENPMTMVYKIKNIGTLFDGTCEFKIPAYSFSGNYTREEISGYASSGRLSLSQLDLKFYDLGITFPEEGVAKVSLTARVTGKSNSGEYIDEAHELESVLKKVEKKWLFSKIEVVEVLKK